MARPNIAKVRFVQLDVDGDDSAGNLVPTTAYRKDVRRVGVTFEDAAGNPLVIGASGSSPAPTTIPAASSLNIDATNVNTVIVSGAIADLALDISNGSDGQSLTLVVTIDATGNRTITPGSTIKIPDGLLGTFSGLEASKSYLIGFRKLGGLWWCVSLSPPYS